jgi:hypothetical protein
MPKEPVTNKYGAKITHEGAELTWNVENKSPLNKTEAADFYEEAAAAQKEFKKRLAPKPGMSPLLKACIFFCLLVAAACAANQVGSQLFCQERWCW